MRPEVAITKFKLMCVHRAFQSLQYCVPRVRAHLVKQLRKNLRAWVVYNFVFNHVTTFERTELQLRRNICALFVARNIFHCCQIFIKLPLVLHFRFLDTTNARSLWCAYG